MIEIHLIFGKLKSLLENEDLCFWIADCLQLVREGGLTCWIKLSIIADMHFLLLVH